MEKLTNVLDTIIRSSPPAPQTEREQINRRTVIGYLFAAYGDLLRDEKTKAAVYLTETDEIPLEFLARAVKRLIREHKWANPPTIAEIWRVAQKVAGMDRDQYRAGFYLPPPRGWPPAGQRHSVNAGQFEPLAEGRLLSAGESAKLLAAVER
jgi:hypothetical protein